MMVSFFHQQLIFGLVALTALPVLLPQSQRQAYALAYAPIPSGFNCKRHVSPFAAVTPSSALLSIVSHDVECREDDDFNAVRSASSDDAMKIIARMSADRVSRSIQPSKTAADTTTRRQVLTRVSTSISLLGIAAFATPQPSTAATEGVVSERELAALLKPVPTFAIVDPDGVPYFVVGEDAKLTSYFFTSFGEAQRILDVAIKSSDKATKDSRKELLAKKKSGSKGGSVTLTKEEEEEIGINPWKSSRITSVPLDLAVSLASKGKLGGGYFRVAPSETDIEDALGIDGTDDLPEGKVPLFYVDEMTLTPGGSTSSSSSPLYFRKSELVEEWKKQQQTGAETGALSSSVDRKSVV